MAEIRPFRGIRYNSEAVGDLSQVIAPIYDVIDDEARDLYYNKHPYNVIRLILNRPKAGDEGPDQPYLRARDFLDKWLDQRVLIQDDQPAFYLYRQRYQLENRTMDCTGIIARVRLTDFSEGTILPHENILPKPVEDRTRLLEFTQTNFSMIYSLFSDPQESLKDDILAEMEQFPLAQFRSVDGIEHDVWGVTGEGFIRKIESFFQDRQLYIADGHHRYTTALENAKRLRESGAIVREDDPRNYVMMMIVEMENPGLSVLPVHRVVLKKDLDSDAILKALETWFEVILFDGEHASNAVRISALLGELEDAGVSGPQFGIYLNDGRLYRLSWKPGLDVEKEIGGEGSVDYKSLDVTVLQKLAIEKALGISPDRSSIEKNLRFTKDAPEAIGFVDRGEASMAFLLNPTRVQEVRRIADNGEKMPQKSTYFQPKPSSGVIMNRITEW